MKQVENSSYKINNTRNRDNYDSILSIYCINETNRRDIYKFLTFSCSLIDWISKLNNFYKQFITRLYIENDIKNANELKILTLLENIHFRSIELFLSLIVYHREISINGIVDNNYINNVKSKIQSFIYDINEMIKTSIDELVSNDNCLTGQDFNSNTNEVIECINNIMNDYANDILNKILSEDYNYLNLNIPPKVNGEYFENIEKLINELNNYIKLLMVMTINCYNLFKSMKDYSNNNLNNDYKLYVDNSLLNYASKFKNYCIVNKLFGFKEKYNMKLQLLDDIPDYIIDYYKNMCRTK